MYTAIFRPTPLEGDKTDFNPQPDSGLKGFLNVAQIETRLERGKFIHRQEKSDREEADLSLENIL